jgi:uncharacterized protein YcfJ
MRNQSKLRIFIPLMLMGFLCFGAVSAEARDYRRGNHDEVARDAAVGAVVGTIAQIITGRTEGHEILKGAVIGGTLGAVVGSSRDSRHGYYGRYDRRDGYYRDGYYRDGYSRGGYSRRGDGYRDGYHQDGYYRDGNYRDSYYQDGYYRDGGYDSRYSHDSRYYRPAPHRHSSHCGHR